MLSNNNNKKQTTQNKHVHLKNKTRSFEEWMPYGQRQPFDEKNK